MIYLELVTDPLTWLNEVRQHNVLSLKEVLSLVLLCCRLVPVREGGRVFTFLWKTTYPHPRVVGLGHVT